MKLVNFLPKFHQTMMLKRIKLEQSGRSNAVRHCWQTVTGDELSNSFDFLFARAPKSCHHSNWLWLGKSLQRPEDGSGCHTKFSHTVRDLLPPRHFRSPSDFSPAGFYTVWLLGKQTLASQQFAARPISILNHFTCSLIILKLMIILKFFS